MKTDLVCSILERIGYVRRKDDIGLAYVNPEDSDVSILWAIRPDKVILDSLSIPQMDIPKYLVLYSEGSIDHKILLARLQGLISEEECRVYGPMQLPPDPFKPYLSMKSKGFRLIKVTPR